jgi:hypothetical protein
MRHPCRETRGQSGKIRRGTTRCLLIALRYTGSGIFPPTGWWYERAVLRFLVSHAGGQVGTIDRFFSVACKRSYPKKRG